MKGQAVLFFLAAILLASCSDATKIGTGMGDGDQSKVIDHESASIEGLAEARVEKAKATLHVAYWHTSHGSQLVTGMDGMDAFFGGKGLYVLNGSSGLALHEEGTDIGNPGIPQFEASVRAYLAANPATNVVMASWCGQVSNASSDTITDYLTRMEAMEKDFPGVTFVYMTGHSDGTGRSGNLHLRNQQIRDYCTAHDKYLYDFYDIECYDPDGTYYGDRYVNDACAYDSNGDGSQDSNWATAWQVSHAVNVYWWNCSSAHSEPLNANRKAMAAWQLFALIAGK
jgi:hypothetical protein